MKTLKWNKVNIITSSNENNIRQTLLNNRKINKENEKSFFFPDYCDLLDPYLLDWVDMAVDRIIESKNNKERVVIFWDYDVDWVSSTALLVRFLNEIWIEVSYRLPHRVNDWYWLKKHFIDDLVKNNVRLIITVDCGTRDLEVINYCNSQWIDIIITDHHWVPENLIDNAISIINPKKVNCNYPNKDLSGSWVAFKLLHAISQRIHSSSETNNYLKNYIDFAMLGTVADCMQLTWENRVITYLGLKQIKNSKSHWLKKLIEWSDLDNLDWDVVWFKIWPRLNAAWRMDTPYKALKVLLAWESNLDEAMDEIENLNTKRKVTTEKFALDAHSKIDNSKNVLFYESDKIEHWIIGLIAWRLSEAYNKVAIVLREEEDRYIASARWPHFINFIGTIEWISELFEVYGWHNQAAWFTISKVNFPIFKDKIEKLISTAIIEVDTDKIINVESRITLDQIGFDLIKFIESMRPFWFGNPKPLFLIEDISFDKIDYIWKEQKHLKFSIYWEKIEFKAFWIWEYFDKLKKAPKLNIIFEVERNTWNNRETVSLNIKDIVIR